MKPMRKIFYIIVNFVDRIWGMVPLTCDPPYAEVKSSGTTIISPNYLKEFLYLKVS